MPDWNYLMIYEIGAAASAAIWAIGMVISISIWNDRKSDYPNPSLVQREEIFDAARDIIQISPLILAAPLWPVALLALIVFVVFAGGRGAWRTTNKIRANARGELT